MFFKEFFYFQKSDRQVILFLLSIFVIALTLFYFVGNAEIENKQNETDSLCATKNNIKGSNVEQNGIYYNTEQQEIYLFPFDPNTADSTQLLQLGLSPWQVRSIYRYRAKGGVFRKSSDFAKVYGLTIKQFKQLEPYINISNSYQEAATLFVNEQEKAYEKDTIRYPKKIKQGEYIDLNSADTTQLKRVPGVGSGFAKAILKYKMQLGGYYSIAQLKEINNFPEEAIAYFKIQQNDICKININKQSLNELKKHPYINFFQAREISDYKRLKGKIKGLDDLKMMKNFSISDLNRLKPYIEF